MAETISAEFAEPYFDLDVYDTSQIPKDLVNQKLILKHRILPLIQRGQILYVATSNPSNIEAIDAIRFNSKLLVEPVIVEHHKLEKFYTSILQKKAALTSMMKSLISMLILIPTAQEDEEEAPQGDEAPIVKYINKLLIDAIRMGASDLHFEPYEKSYRVRYRVDGVLRQIANPLYSLQTA